MDGIGVVEAVAKKRGCMSRTRRGMEADLEKAAMILLTDYREGRLGRISLETPQSRAAMLEAAARHRARRADQNPSIRGSDRFSAESTKRNSTVGGFQPGAVRKTFFTESFICTAMR
jgi:hypothetical protein